MTDTKRVAGVIVTHGQLAGELLIENRRAFVIEREPVGIDQPDGCGLLLRMRARRGH